MAARVRSRMEFAHLDAARAARVDSEAFATQIYPRAGGSPSLPRGHRSVHLLSTHAAQIALPHGRGAVIESSQPIAVETSRGHRAPVDLGLIKTGGVFESVRPLVGVLIPSHAGEGVQLPEPGISLTPVDGHGGPLGGAAGAIDGASVLYANTQTDADTVVKPTVAGVEASTILRSVDSPSTLYFRVGLPTGARLVQSRAGAGAVQIVKGVDAFAIIRPPGAVDVAGAAVPVSMSVRGNLLVVSVSTRGDYAWPIEVDPELATIEDSSLGPTECHKEGEAERESSNWCWHAEKGTFHAPIWSSGKAVELYNDGAVEAGGYTVMSYLTQGESKIYEVGADTAGQVESSVAKVEFAHERSKEEGAVESGGEDALPLKEEYKDFGYNHFCANSKSEGTCASSEGSAKNLVAYKVEAKGALTTSDEIEFTFEDPTVYIAQEKGPEATFNENEAEIEVEKGVKRLNALYKAQSERSKDPWLGPYSNTAFQVKAHDPGIGVAWGKVTIGSFKLEEPIYEDGKCNGVQCNESYSTDITYNPEMAEGEPTIQWYAADLAGRTKGCKSCLGLTAEGTQIIKVDGRPPGKLEVSGWPARREISAAPHTLTISARDEGPEGKPSSGLKSIAVSIDGGKETALSGASCAEGPCTATGSYTLHAEELSEGVHRLVVTATDNANNVASKEFTFDVRHGTPIPIGPGTVDPSTGQLRLSATDVSLAGAGGVSRVYESRDLSTGAEGPLGPQWALSLGGGEGITVLPTGGVVLASSAGGTTTFTRNEKGEFESPLGDENIKVEAKEEVGKGISEYLLKDANAGTTTVFTQPVGTEDTVPTYADQFGQEGANLGNPVSAAIDAHGNVWVTDYNNDRIVEFSSAGVLVGAYGSAGQYPNEFNAPWGIAVNKSTGNTYVSDLGNNRVVELNASGGFLRAFGWGVAPGGESKDEFQDCTSYCQAGIAGAGAGQFNGPQGVAVDSSGNVWVSEYYNDRIQEFNAEGKYLNSYGTAGTGDGQYEAPAGIAISGGDLYVADQNNNRVQEISTSGTFVRAIGWGVSNGEEKLEVCTTGCRVGIAGSGNGQFNGPRGLAVDPAGDLYVSEINNDRVQELTGAGAFVTKFGSAGSGKGQFSQPMGVAVASADAIYVTDYANKRMEEWMRPAWLPARSEGALKNITMAYAYKPVEEEGKTVIEPKEALAATPAGITCVGTKGEVEVQYLKDGCRALTFNYAEGTTAKEGENKSDWGEYDGRLSKVVFHAAKPSTKPMEEKPMEEKTVAEYSYDKQGRLRAEWDPRIEGIKDCGEKTCVAIKTTYGYDSEGHVTAVTPPGQESWGLIYGTITGDSNTGRLLKVTRAKSSAPLWGGEVPKNTEAPALSGTPAVSVRMAVSNGSWSNSPVVYGYQWEDCNSEGKGCTAIVGATNANYTPASSDVGHTLVAEVTAINGGGAVAATSPASAVVAARAGSYTQTVDSGYSLNAVSCISASTTCVVSDSAGKALYATNVSSSSAATWKSWSGPAGESPSQALECPSSSLCLLADGKETAGGNLYYATSLGGSWSEAYSPSFGVDAISCVSTAFCVDGQDGDGYFRYSTSPGSASWTLEQQGEAVMKGAFCLSSSFCAIVDSKGDLHVAVSESQVKSSSWKETDVDGSTSLNGVACLSTSVCVAVDKSGDALSLKIESSGAASTTTHDIDGTTSVTGVACPGSSTCVAVDAAGNVFVSKNSGESWTKLYSLGDDLTSVSCMSTSLCATADTSGKVTTFNLTGTGTEGELRSPQPGSTIEYRIPTTGGEVPQNLSKEEVEKWGQKDDPFEGTAIFPPDEPQSWPASDYTKATIDYTDEQGRTVNTVAPGGAITTSEYNEANEVTRTLTPENRAAAMAEGCKSVSKKECESAEGAEKLDTFTEYNEGDSQIVRVLGPEHKVKLASGSEVQARAVTHDYYNEGSKEAEEKNKETYNLLTKSTNGALLSSGEEVEMRETVNSYSGQEDLGWKLRKPTSTTIDPRTLDLTKTTVYEESTVEGKKESNGNVVETETPGGSAVAVYPLAYTGAFGSEGLGEGEFNHPEDAAVDGEGDVWVDDKNNGRIEKFSASGTFIASYGSKGSGEKVEFSNAWALAINKSTGDAYVADTGNDRIEELNKEGGFVRVFGKTGSGSGELDEPSGITVDPSGDIWVADTGHNRIVEFSSTGAYIHAFGREGKGSGEFVEPMGVAISEGEIYVSDYGNNRVQELTPSGTYLAQFGSTGSAEGQFKEPLGIAANPTSGDLYVADSGNDRIEEFSPAGKFLTDFGFYGTGKGQFHTPTGLTVSASGELYVADEYNARVEEWKPAEAGGSHLLYSTQTGSKGTGEGSSNSRRWSRSTATATSGSPTVKTTGSRSSQRRAKYLASYGSYGEGERQFKGPTGIAVNQSTGNVYVADCGNSRIEELSSTGTYLGSFGGHGTEPGKLDCPYGVKLDSSGNVWVADTGNNRIEEYSSTGIFIAAYGSKGSGEDEFDEPTDLAFSGEDVYVVDYGNERIEELSGAGHYLGQFGSKGNGGGQFSKPEGIAADSAGNLYVTDTGNDRMQEFSSSGKFLATFGSYGSGEGQLNGPIGIAINAGGDAYVADHGNDRVEVWTPSSQAAHDTKTIYYSPGIEAPVEACWNRPEWANLPCETALGAQPTVGKPLPVTTVVYNMWDQPETVEEKFGSGSKPITRTTKTGFDAAGRPLTSEETSTIDEPLPLVTNEYNSETGALESQSATIKGEVKAITAKDNKLGQIVEYKDASGNIAKYTYEEGSDGRLLEVSEGKGEEAASKQTYTYESTTGLISKLVDSGAGAAGTFTASYDVEGRMTSEIYPNGMCANTSYDSTGAATSISYVKTRNCSEEHPTVWFSDSMVAGIHGEMLSQTSTLSSESYAYDEAGRLTETQETPAGQGCITRLYTYDEESNRESLTTRAPGSEGKCASEGGTTQWHVYDEVNRLEDEGVEYETFGNATKLPAADAGEHEIKSTYYLDNQVDTEEQNKILDTYTYDPAGRTLETSAEHTETKAKATTVAHYAGTGSTPTWTSQEGKWTRNIPGIGGGLQATAEQGKTPMLQLRDLQGNIVAEAVDSEAETKPPSTYNSTEFGVPSEAKTPPEYAWLGASGLATETAFGTGVTTQSGASYVPQIARSLQTAPIIPPGDFPDGQGTGGQYDSEIPGWYISVSQQESATTLAQWTAEQEAKRKEAEQQAQEAEEGWEDPEWAFRLSLQAAAALSGAIDGLELSYYIGGGELAEKVAEWFAEDTKVDFIKQFEGGVKEALEDNIFGYSLEDVARWVFNLGGELETCYKSEFAQTHKHAYCQVDITTKWRDNWKKGEIGPGKEIEIPDFDDPPSVQACASAGKGVNCTVDLFEV